MSKTHTYRGYEISPVEYADKKAQGYRWYIEATHSKTGMSYDSQLCTHCMTLAVAKEIIDERIRDNAAMAEYDGKPWLAE